ncbi:MAG: FtsX-like permease family protein [Bacilli bacterium]|nr:FtsX-like permease family protein [Bacilli bacterium]
MKSIFQICRSIFKGNKGFSLCLCLMSLLSFATSVFAASFAKSSTSTIENFFNYTGVPEALITTELISESDLDVIKSISGVKEISPRLQMDVNIEDKNQKQLSARFLSYDENAPFKLEFINKRDIETENLKVYISYEFADYNGIKINDDITLKTLFGDLETTVAATISSVETFKCIKDEMSSYEAYQFGYIYIPKTELDKIVDLEDLTNSLSIYFNEGINIEKQHEILKEIENRLETDYLSGTIVSEMDSIKSINDDISTIKVLCIFIPGVVLLISLGFSFVFLKIIIENQRKTIALLKSLGYKSGKIIGIFVLFDLLINIISLLLGLPIGLLLLRFCVGLIASANGILTLKISISYALTIVLILVVFAIGALACLLTSKSITKIEPSIIDNSVNQNIETPKILSKIKCNPFIKISLAELLRKYKRLIIGSFCMAACIITMCVGFEGNLTIAHPSEVIYGERFQYDLMVRDIDYYDYSDIESNISNIKVIEPITFFEAEVNDSKIKISSIKEGSQLIMLKNSKNEIIYPGNGVIIDEMYASINKAKVGDTISIENHTLTITGVARELALPYFYISQNTAEDVFSSTTNCALLKIEETSNFETVKKEIVDLLPLSYLIEMNSQKENMQSRTRATRIIMLVLSALSFLIGSLFVFNITIIDFNEKKTQYATLRALGTPINKLSIVGLIENATRLLIGIILAIPLSNVLISILLKLLSNASTQYVFVNYWPCLFISIGISFLYIVVSLLISRAIIKKMNIIEKLNRRE